MVLSTPGVSNFTPITTLNAFHAMDNSQDAATPGNDGVPNILKFAFNMTTNNYGDLATYNHQTMATNGTSGLPLIAMNSAGQLTITAVERLSLTAPGIIYVPQVTTDLTQPWTTLSATVRTVPINNAWQRVIYTGYRDSATVPMRFVRLAVGF